ncbi:hypothetical protein TorRG33x02_039600 [Trema orientale]|uniref:Uncharacterized protein n=1 Tax=Trema orientale TaxID=63057 RepID=A0A2P5FQX2_TREOI|nr:hypothetical protein TorRG33x02_039600 [Trema orientale]
MGEVSWHCTHTLLLTCLVSKALLLAVALNECTDMRIDDCFLRTITFVKPKQQYQIQISPHTRLSFEDTTDDKPLFTNRPIRSGLHDLIQNLELGFNDVIEFGGIVTVGSYWMVIGEGCGRRQNTKFFLMVSILRSLQPQPREKAEKEGYEKCIVKTSFKATEKALAENEAFHVNEFLASFKA